LASEGNEEETKDVAKDKRGSRFNGAAELLLDLLPRDDRADAFFARELFDENNPFPSKRSPGKESDCNKAFTLKEDDDKVADEEEEDGKEDADDNDDDEEIRA
jgi:hypothetical protein